MNQARQASLSITNSWSPPKPMSIELVMPCNYLILCRPLLLLPSIFPSIRVFSNESALRMRLPKYWSFSFNISPFNEHLGLTSFRMAFHSPLIPWWLTSSFCVYLSFSRVVICYDFSCNDIHRKNIPIGHTRKNWRWFVFSVLSPLYYIFLIILSEIL